MYGMMNHLIYIGVDGWDDWDTCDYVHFYHSICEWLEGYAEKTPCRLTFITIDYCATLTLNIGTLTLYGSTDNLIPNWKWKILDMLII